MEITEELDLEVLLYQEAAEVLLQLDPHLVTEELEENGLQIQLLTLEAVEVHVNLGHLQEQEELVEAVMELDLLVEALEVELTD